MIILAHVVLEKHQGGQPLWEHGGGGEVLVHHEAPSHAWVDLLRQNLVVVMGPGAQAGLQQTQQVKVFVRLQRVKKVCVDAMI